MLKLNTYLRYRNVFDYIKFGVKLPALPLTTISATDILRFMRGSALYQVSKQKTCQRKDKQRDHNHECSQFLFP